MLNVIVSLQCGEAPLTNDCFLLVLNVIVSLQCGEAPLTNDCFLLVLKTTDSVAELEAVKEKVDLDIARQRSKDSGGEDGKDSDF